MTDDPNDLSRRDLLGGFLRRPIREIHDRMPEGLRRAIVPARVTKRAPRAPVPPPDRRQRPATETVRATPDASGRFLADLGTPPVGVGESRRVVAAELAEALVVVRVSETHFAAATGDCPVDLSDVLWDAHQDELWCPGCGSRWRLDGAVVCGPSRVELLSLHVDEAEGTVRIDVP